MKYLYNYNNFKILESQNIDDILDRMNKGEKFTDVQLQAAGIDPSKFPKNFQTKPIIQLVDGFRKIEGVGCPSAETPEEYMYKFFDTCFNNYLVIEGEELDPNTIGNILCKRDGNCENPYESKSGIKWTLLTEGDETKVGNVMIAISQDLKTGEKKILTFENIRIEKFQEKFPDWQFFFTYKRYDYPLQKNIYIKYNIKDGGIHFDKKHPVFCSTTPNFTTADIIKMDSINGLAHPEILNLLIPVQNYSGGLTDAGAESGKIFQEYFKSWICEVFGLKDENDLKLQTGGISSSRITSMGRALLHLRQDHDEEAKARHSGEIVGKLVNGVIKYF